MIILILQIELCVFENIGFRIMIILEKKFTVMKSYTIKESSINLDIHKSS